LIERTGYTVARVRPTTDEPTSGGGDPVVPAEPRSADDVYDRDGLRSVHNHDFMNDPAFSRAYERGCLAAADYRWQWRVHIGLWAATTASKIPGDFVECGVNRGFMSSAIMEYLDWDSLDKTFYLLDTYEGLDEHAITPPELDGGAMARNDAALASGFYVQDVEAVRANFAQWDKVRIIKGPIPNTLSRVESPNVSYLHLDMNTSLPEVAALEFFWDRLAPGAVVLLDDYAYRGYEPQKRAMDAVAVEKEVAIASLPTGQGLLVKPPRPS
jgi:hypothetical protein